MEQTIQAGTVTAICISEKRGTQKKRWIPQGCVRTRESRVMRMLVTGTDR